MSVHTVPNAGLINIKEKMIVNIGIIGMGDMGRLYARKFYDAGWMNINVCDLPSRFESLKSEFPKYNVHKDGHGVSRVSDYIIYSVEAKNIGDVVSTFGPSTKVGAVVAGQTSVKEPEIQAFESYLPEDVHIVTCHSLHGPKVAPEGQPLVIIRHRSSDEKYELVKRILSALGSEFVYLSYKEHDTITADTQAVTHLAFKSMGTAWKAAAQFPWEDPTYIGGIENVKIAMMLRIYSNKWHVYAGLAIMNPAAKLQIKQYAKSVSDLFKLMIQEKKDEFIRRVKDAGEYVFGSQNLVRPLLLSDDLLEKYSLSRIPKEKRKPNSHLSLLAMVDCWHQLGINPYDHLICQTPPFRLWLGITEYLFKSPDLLNESLQAALYAKELRADDMEFYASTQGWCQTILVGSFEAYRFRFEETQAFFKERLKEGSELSTKMIEMVKLQMQRRDSESEML